MNGLPWFKVVSNVAFDGDLEKVSDAAFRTFIELIGISAFDLSDGKVSFDRAHKLCNTPDFDLAIEELLRAGFVQQTRTGFAVKQYRKYQETRREVASKRAKARDRVRRYRQSTNDVGTGDKSKSKSKSTHKATSNTPPIVPPKGDERVAEVFAYWQNVMDHHQSKLTKERYKKIAERLAEGYSPDDIKKAIDGCKNIPHNMGHNTNSKVYDDLELICRNGTKLEYFIGSAVKTDPYERELDKLCNQN